MKTARYTPEERAARDADSKRRWKENQKAKRLSPEAVERSDKGRAVAEKKQGKGSDKAGSVAEATKRVKSENSPVKKVVSTPTELRTPTRGEIDMILSVMKPANDPLIQVERDLKTMGVVGSAEAVARGDALVKEGEIPASEKELEAGATMTAGTLVNFAPSIMIYMYPIGLFFFSVGFIGSRALIFWRIKRAFDDMEKRTKEAAEREAALKSKTSPTAIASNGAATAHEPARTV